MKEKIVKLTQTQKDRMERTAYVALDAILRLSDAKVGLWESGHISVATDAIRAIISKIQDAEIRRRGEG